MDENSIGALRKGGKNPFLPIFVVEREGGDDAIC